MIFGTALGAMELGGAWNIGLNILQKMTVCMVAPSVVAYGSCLGPCRWPWATHLLGDMALRSTQPDLVARTSALLSLSLGHAWRRALAMAVPSFLGISAVLRACEHRTALSVVALGPDVGALALEALRKRLYLKASKGLGGDCEWGRRSCAGRMSVAPKFSEVERS